MLTAGSKAARGVTSLNPVRSISHLEVNKLCTMGFLYSELLAELTGLLFSYEYNLAGPHSHGVIRKNITIVVPCLSCSRCSRRAQAQSASTLQFQKLLIRYYYQQILTSLPSGHPALAHFSLHSFSLAASLPHQPSTLCRYNWRVAQLHSQTRIPPTLPDREGRKTLILIHQSLIS